MNAPFDGLGTPADRALMRAQGKALALTAVLLQRVGGVTVKEFADLLALLSATAAETEPQTGDILALWARMVEDAVQPGG